MIAAGIADETVVSWKPRNGKRFYFQRSSGRHERDHDRRLGYSLSSVSVIRDQTANDNLTIAMHLAQDKIEQLKTNRTAQ